MRGKVQAHLVEHRLGAEAEGEVHRTHRESRYLRAGLAAEPFRTNQHPIKLRRSTALMTMRGDPLHIFKARAHPVPSFEDGRRILDFFRGAAQPAPIFRGFDMHRFTSLSPTSETCSRGLRWRSECVRHPDISEEFR
jgi:hypothetical protein